jgi:hypothetical protein
MNLRWPVVKHEIYGETPSNKLHDVLELMRMHNGDYDALRLQSVLRIVRSAVIPILSDEKSSELDSVKHEQRILALEAVLWLLSNLDSDTEVLMTTMRVVRHALDAIQNELRTEEVFRELRRTAA